MKLVYTHPNLMLVENAGNLLENAGITTEIRNRYAIGGMGELAPINVWPELWLKRDADFNWAQTLLESLEQEQEQSPVAEDWVCEQCGEENAGNFAACWNCQTMRAGL